MSTSSLTSSPSGWDQLAVGLAASLPLTMLTIAIAVRCLVIISHIFTQDSQFCFMLDTLSDIYRHHPAEEELLLGLSKPQHIALSSPVAGVPGARILHHPRDSPHPSPPETGDRGGGVAGGQFSEPRASQHVVRRL